MGWDGGRGGDRRKATFFGMTRNGRIGSVGFLCIPKFPLRLVVVGFERGIWIVNPRLMEPCKEGTREEDSSVSKGVEEILESGLSFTFSSSSLSSRIPHKHKRKQRGRERRNLGWDWNIEKASSLSSLPTFFLCVSTSRKIHLHHFNPSLRWEPKKQKQKHKEPPVSQLSPTSHTHFLQENLQIKLGLDNNFPYAHFDWMSFKVFRRRN